MKDKIIVGMKEKKCVVPEQKGSEMEDKVLEKRIMVQLNQFLFKPTIHPEDQLVINEYNVRKFAIPITKEIVTTDLKKEIFGIIDKKIKWFKMTSGQEFTTQMIIQILEKIKKAILENETFSNFRRKAPKIEGK